MFSSPLLKDAIHVYLTGGEPFLDGRIVDICEVVKKRLDATISLNTNGLLPENIEKYGRMIKDMGLDILSFDLSVNGPEEIHDATRGIPGGYGKLMHSHAILEKLNIPHGWTFTVFKHTLQYVGWFRDFMPSEPHTYAYGASTRFLNSPDAGQFSLTKDEVNQVYDDCEDEVLRGYIDCLKLGVGYYNPCYMGSHQVRVDPMGETYLCDYAKAFKLGVPWELNPEDYFVKVIDSKKKLCTKSCSLESCIYGYNQVMSKPLNKVLLRSSIYRSLKKLR